MGGLPPAALFRVRAVVAIGAQGATVGDDVCQLRVLVEVLDVMGDGRRDRQTITPDAAIACALLAQAMSTAQHLLAPLLVASSVVVWILFSAFHTAPILPASR